MSVRYLCPVLTPDHTIADVDTFINAGKQRWPDCKTIIFDEDSLLKTDADIVIKPSGVSTIISHFRDGRLISIDAASFDEAAEIAVWVRSLNPDPDVVVWFTTSVFDGHTILTPGITTQEVIDQWVDHREHNPYEEYPEYFS